MKFTYHPNPVKISFGSPLTEAVQEDLCKKQSVQKVWIIASGRHNTLVQRLSEIECLDVVEHFSRILQHVPFDQVQKARHHVAKKQPDILLAIGGGSAIGLAKAVALKHPLPLWAVPTTYSGSEMTDIYGISVNETKEVGRDKSVLPECVIYDPALSLSMPKQFAAQSALNALAHLVEASYSINNNPYTYNSALHGIKGLFSAINDLAFSEKLEADTNERLLLGSSIAGRSLAEVEMALQHKAAHVLAGNFNLDHAGTHSVLLPYILHFQWPALSEGVQSDLQKAFDLHNPSEGILEILRQLNVPSTLQELGFDKSSTRKAARQICELSFQNPASLSTDIVNTLLEDAYDGSLRKW